MVAYLKGGTPFTEDVIHFQNRRDRTNDTQLVSSITLEVFGEILSSWNK